MRSALILLALIACSAIGFEPAECPPLSRDSHGTLHDQLYRDLMRGTYDSSDCFEFRGKVVQSIEGGYRVDTEGWGTNYPGDVYVEWEGDYRFVEGDQVVVTGVVAEPLTFETLIGSQRTIPAFHGSSMLDMQQHARYVSATRQVMEATKQLEYNSDYEQRAVDALQMVAQDCHPPDEITHRLSYFNFHQLDELNLKYSIGPVPDRIGPDTVPHILLEGYYKMKPLQPGRSWKRGQITARWTGRGCGFRDIQLNEGVRPTITPTPTKDPNAPEPTYTPRPAPTRR